MDTTKLKRSETQQLEGDKHRAREYPLDSKDSFALCTPSESVGLCKQSAKLSKSKASLCPAPEDSSSIKLSRAKGILCLNDETFYKCSIK